MSPSELAALLALTCAGCDLVTEPTLAIDPLVPLLLTETSSVARDEPSLADASVDGGAFEAPESERDPLCAPDSGRPYIQTCR